MTEKSTAGAGVSAASRALLASRLSWSMPLVFVTGVASCVMTRVLYGIYEPDRLARVAPTISEAAAFEPGMTVFRLGMFAVMVFGITGWILNFAMNRQRLKALPAGATAYGLVALSALTGILGIVAVVSLESLALIPMHDKIYPNRVHIELSILFFSTQSSCYLVDGIVAVWSRKVLSGLDGSVERTSLKARGAIALTIAAASLWYLYMFLDRSDIWGRDVGQHIYVTTEYIISVLSFAYPYALFPEARRYFLLRAQSLQSAPVSVGPTPALAFEG